MIRDVIELQEGRKGNIDLAKNTYRYNMVVFAIS